VAEIVELRVHGVGGPQGPKILGWPSGTDVATVPPMEIDRGDGDLVLVPSDGGSRFVRPVADTETDRPAKEAYEWGGLTSGSFLKSLWIVFLPFTFLNVGGWARQQGGQGDKRSSLRDVGARFLGYLGTVTYVLWFGYLLLELVAIQWRNRILTVGVTSNDNELAEAAARNVLRPLAFFSLLGVLALLAWVNRKSGQDFECENPDRPPEPAEPTYPSTMKPHQRIAHALRGAEPAIRSLQVASAATLGAGAGLYWSWVERPDLLYLALAASAVVLALLCLQRVVMPEPEPVAGQPPLHWRDEETVTHPDFFAHQLSLLRLRHRHVVVAAAAGGFVVALFWAGRDLGQSRIGLAIVLLANLQVLSLVLVWLHSLAFRNGRIARAGLLTLGTVLCHAVFAGTALWLHDRLSSIPAGPVGTPSLFGGRELALNDKFLIALVLAAVVLAVSAVLPVPREPTAQGMVARLARRLPWSGALMALTFVVIFAGYTLSVLGSETWQLAADTGAWHDTPRRWYLYSGGVGDSGFLQSLGSKVLVLLPVAFVLAMRSSTSVGKVIGNVWDVSTFWPRRYHPFAVPPYSERAVPELRLRVQRLLDTTDGVILSGHSQGSVLSVAALGPMLLDPAATTAGAGAPTATDNAATARPLPLHLISFGSPLGTLYAPVFGGAIGRDTLEALRDALTARGRTWTVLWRKTDPIGGPVFDEAPLADPLGLADWKHGSSVDEVRPRPPLDRPPPWKIQRVHGFYPAERAYRDAVDAAATDLSAPT
jgi:hypothetical protein